MRSFEHAMLREIYEQPEAIRRTLALYTQHGALNPDFVSQLAGWENPNGEILVAASGSSRHAGLAAEVTLEELCGLAVDVEYASEYDVRGGADRRHPSIIVISQSGETTDTLSALRDANRHGRPTLAITNVDESTMAREATVSLPLAAGRELAIPATKSFIAQLTVLYLLALHEASRLKTLTPEQVTERLKELENSPDTIASALEGWELQLAELAKKYSTASTFLFIGRGVHYAIAREGALKLKEASYVHAEGYPSGELKHGPNALVSDKVPIVALATVDRADEQSVIRHERTLKLLEELKQQGAHVIALANEGDNEVAALVSDCVYVPKSSEHLLPILEVIPLQFFAYFMALEHGVDVDKPRNLSKAVIEK